MGCTGLRAENTNEMGVRLGSVGFFNAKLLLQLQVIGTGWGNIHLCVMPSFHVWSIVRSSRFSPPAYHRSRSFTSSTHASTEPFTSIVGLSSRRTTPSVRRRTLLRELGLSTELRLFILFLVRRHPRGEFLLRGVWKIRMAISRSIARPGCDRSIR